MKQHKRLIIDTLKSHATDLYDEGGNRCIAIEDTDFEYVADAIIMELEEAQSRRPPTISELAFKHKVAEILKDNVYFSAQAGDYIVFGALDKIWELHKNQLPSIKVTDFKPNIEIPDLVDIEQVEQANVLPDKEIYALGSPDNETELEADKIYKAYCKLRGIDLHLLDASVFYLGFKAGKKLKQQPNTDLSVWERYLDAAVADHNDYCGRVPLNNRDSYHMGAESARNFLLTSNY